MLMKNNKGKALRMKAAVLTNPPRDKDGKVPTYVMVEAGTEVECKDGYCHPMIAANGSRTPSIIEKVAPGMEPADEAEKEEWLKVPEKNWQPPKVEKTAAELRAMGVAPKIAKLQAQKAAAEAKQKAVLDAARKEAEAKKAAEAEAKKVAEAEAAAAKAEEEAKAAEPEPAPEPEEVKEEPKAKGKAKEKKGRGRK